ncbi:bifunctional DNA-formamidopyrimidine glycosylase/DNA-(apurinic or apyrimidinic site) lyase [Phycisphaera mikurensis]|uniref:Formamidopyrimidine-DNA glycosylase n=1 Tax=Phycisphaera mikurensis (strain NBRC 102666 / KCTC 22515 / FYK2301M01) TaxID=1142394 RepID=I0IJC2_PHYMF|nr:bifunctional DNA-formamidopyrimidine glycosylase/DNA-(apurinic or apyrimidinic site) lyase [Phycisphaera mikurensis]MBB6441841.1 formamidopyrimidine-DNA glycosylase [Phycisphaera mikurensis]BAM05360.1 formamidopyrimidine-DNA glycosylase/DNA-(apurinic or apyrimidinic site) lyase [Phycisphaera mikurensis NBRC 102666]
MPELPEVETVRRGLAARLTGRRVAGVTLGPHPVVRASLARRVYATPAPGQLLAGDVVAGVHRHGKQLAIEGAAGGAVWVHLGMSGGLRFVADAAAEPVPPHTHARWTLGSGAELRFVDPRRFGGLGVHPSLADLRARRFAALGPDALDARTAPLRAALARTRRPLKAALLDQSVLAGLGNIYADEACFAARLAPHLPADRVPADRIQALVRGIRAVLRRAVALGGSTLRDHAGVDGEAGTAQREHRVYGRGGRPCTACGSPLVASRLAQRATVHCVACQPG